MTFLNAEKVFFFRDFVDKLIFLEKGWKGKIVSKDTG